MEVPRFLWVFSFLLISVKGAETATKENRNISEIDKDSVLIATDSKISSSDASGIETFPELNRIEQILRKEYITDPNMANGSYQTILLCLHDTCKWTRAECEHPQERKNGTGSTGRFPGSFNELIEQFQEMWNSPPPDGTATLWLAFLGSCFGCVLFLHVVLVSWLCVRCCRKLVGGNKKKVNKLYQRFKGKRLVLSLPTGRNIPIDEYVIDATTDWPRVLLIPTSTTNGILTSDVILRGSAMSVGRYGNNGTTKDDGIAKSRKSVVKQKLRRTSGAYFSYQQPSQHTGYINEGYRVSNENMVFPGESEASAELVEPPGTGSTNNLFGTLSTEQVPVYEQATGPQDMQELEDDDEPAHTTVEFEYEEDERETEM